MSDRYYTSTISNNQYNETLNVPYLKGNFTISLLFNNKYYIYSP